MDTSEIPEKVLIPVGVAIEELVESRTLAGAKKALHMGAKGIDINANLMPLDLSAAKRALEMRGYAAGLRAGHQMGLRVGVGVGVGVSLGVGVTVAIGVAVHVRRTRGPAGRDEVVGGEVETSSVTSGEGPSSDERFHHLEQAVVGVEERFDALRLRAEPLPLRDEKAEQPADVSAEVAQNGNSNEATY